jgi:hypothetical protein
MFEVLRAVAAINDGESRGVRDDEMRAIAAAAGMNPRGWAGYFTKGADLLAMNQDGRWITARGRKRLEELGKRLQLAKAS